MEQLSLLNRSTTTNSQSQAAEQQATEQQEKMNYKEAKYKVQEPTLQRREYLHLYDIEWLNPNGDPLADNEPRIDKNTRILIVRDARIKRWIRDSVPMLKSLKNIPELAGKIQIEDDDDIFFIEGYTREERANRLSIKELLQKYIDLRYFGYVNAVESSTNDKEASLTGPIQIKYAKSLHRVQPRLIKGTSVLRSDKNNTQGTFTEEYVIPYALIVAYGIMSELNARHTLLTERDLELFPQLLWFGHKLSLITRSKTGHEPRFLMEVVYKKGTLSHIGELDKLVRLCKVDSEMADEEIRNISEVKIDLTDLKEKLRKYKDKIDHINYIVGDRIEFVEKVEGQVKPVNDIKVMFSELGITAQEYPWCNL